MYVYVAVLKIRQGMQKDSIDIPNRPQTYV